MQRPFHEELFAPRGPLSRKTRRRLRREQMGRANVVNTLTYNGDGTAANDSIFPSQFWNDCPVQAFKDNVRFGRFFDPFGAQPNFVSAYGQLGCTTYQDTGVTISGDPTEIGTMLWGGMDADNDCGAIQGAGAAGTTFNISSAAPQKLWYEVELKKSAVTDNSMAFFAGLAEEGMTAATTTLLGSNSADLADKDLIGFHVDQANGDSVDFVYNKAGAGGVTVKISGLAALTADTWIKLGFLYEPQATKRITIFVDGIANATYVTAANSIAATFPDGEELSPIIAAKKGEATISYLRCRMWQAAQYHV